MRRAIRYAAAGLAAGAVTGILGSGGGLVLVPLLTILCGEEDSAVFPCSLSIMLPICVCSLLIQFRIASPPLDIITPFLVGSVLGGGISALLGRRIPMVWLHRIFGCILIWSGFRCLFS